ncbi:hypothetical protein BDZ89DRAFT_1042896 [Hymenopellis radicata]|nr:hypothetical protein BDZ89DRAFT_1042896 [Hymenopellis radicata]
MDRRFAQNMQEEDQEEYELPKTRRKVPKLGKDTTLGKRELHSLLRIPPLVVRPRYGSVSVANTSKDDDMPPQWLSRTDLVLERHGSKGTRVTIALKPQNDTMSPLISAAIDDTNEILLGLRPTFDCRPFAAGGGYLAVIADTGFDVDPRNVGARLRTGDDAEYVAHLLPMLVRRASSCNAQRGPTLAGVNRRKRWRMVWARNEWETTEHALRAWWDSGSRAPSGFVVASSSIVLSMSSWETLQVQSWRHFVQRREPLVHMPICRFLVDIDSSELKSKNQQSPYHEDDWPMDTSWSMTLSTAFMRRGPLTETAI